MLRRLLIGTAVLVALAIVGVAWATIPSKDGTINACYMKATGIVRIIDPDTQQCHRWETPISWNQTGPQGPAGTARAYATVADFPWYSAPELNPARSLNVESVTRPARHYWGLLHSAREECRGYGVPRARRVTHRRQRRTTICDRLRWL